MLGGLKSLGILKKEESTRLIILVLNMCSTTWGVMLSHATDPPIHCRARPRRPRGRPEVSSPATPELDPRSVGVGSFLTLGCSYR